MHCRDVANCCMSTEKVLDGGSTSAKGLPMVTGAAFNINVGIKFTPRNKFNLY